MQRLLIVSATRKKPDQFIRESALGRCLSKLAVEPPQDIGISVACENTEGLPAIYNRQITGSRDDDVLLFVHDDLYIHDFNLFHRIDEALQVFDVVGLAGNTNPNPNHVAWASWLDDQRNVNSYEKKFLSGKICHVGPSGEVITFYGAVPKQCALMDGCFLAARAYDLRRREIRFDERFSFHFYDLDFCRNCVMKGLTLGTWPIAASHGSFGSYTPEWESALRVYQEKWSKVVAG